MFIINYKLLFLFLVLCLVSIMFMFYSGSMRIETHNGQTFDEDNVDVTTDQFSSEASIEEVIEDDEVEVEPYWDLFKHSDIQPDKDVFFIESSGFASNQLK